MSIFKESPSYRPFRYPWAVSEAKKHMIDMHWHENQIDLQDDLIQYNTNGGLATKNVSHEVHKAIVDKVTCLFTELDKTVAGGYIGILHYVKNNEIRNLFLAQAARETTHQRSYALAAESFGFSDSDWMQFAEYVEMQDKLDTMTDSYCQDWMSDELQFCIKLVQLLLGEGIGLFAAFTTLLNFKRQGKFMGFNDVNSWSLRDEQDHVKNNILVLKEAIKELNEVEREELMRIIEILVQRYVEAEHKFIDLVYEIGEQEDLTSDQLKDYILYLGELRKYQIGILSAEDVRPNPLEWMEWIFGENHSNFFEKRVTDYNHAGLIGEINYKKYIEAIRTQRPELL